jgi:pyrimidine-nucleoside phosphorylase
MRPLDWPQRRRTAITTTNDANGQILGFISFVRFVLSVDFKRASSCDVRRLEVAFVNPCQIIARKRDGAALASHEIAHIVRGHVAGDVPDYQMSALAMAIYLRGMDDAETTTLTEEMLRSGKVLEASNTSRRVDKHSTGGIGDKSSLILAPLLACCGLQVPMISGRGLGATGGTLDKLESIRGFRTNLSLDEIRDVVERVGCVITGATAELVPADRKLYALRDVTATVESIPLITASIMSKKLAESLSALVLDVKFGSGAFMKSKDDARRLARSMVAVGRRMGVETTALLTDMNQPNGRLAGNAAEVDESLEVLAGHGRDDQREMTIALATEVLLMKRLAVTADQARGMLLDHLSSGRALNKFREMVQAQGGDLDAPRPRAAKSTLAAAAGGFVSAIDVEQLGWAIIEMGGGRKQVGDPIDHSVGIEMLVRLGDRVEPGQPLVNIFAREQSGKSATGRIEQAIHITPEPPPEQPLIAERITEAE